MPKMKLIARLIQGGYFVIINQLFPMFSTKANGLGTHQMSKRGTFNQNAYNEYPHFCFYGKLIVIIVQ